MDFFYTDKDECGIDSVGSSSNNNSSTKASEGPRFPFPSLVKSPRTHRRTVVANRACRPSGGGHKGRTATSGVVSSEDGSRGCFACGAGQSSSLILEPPILNWMDHVVIIGAGAIGGFVGCCLFAAGETKVTLLVRNSKQMERYTTTGFTARSSVQRNFRAAIPPQAIDDVFTTDPSCLQRASCVFVATKRWSNSQIHRWLCQYQVACPVVFLQCGIHIRDDLAMEESKTTVAGKRLESNYQVLESIIIMNVDFDPKSGTVTTGQPISDALIVLDGTQHPQSAQAVCNLFHTSALQLRVENQNNFHSLQASKLQVDMINAINALSGGTIAETLQDHGYRFVLSHCIDECRAVFAAHNISLQVIGNEMSSFRFTYMSSLLRSWNWVFLSAMGSQLEHLQCKCSMLQDLERRTGRTEIDVINGAVVRLGKLGGVPTPITKKVVDLVHRAVALQMGSPMMSSGVLLAEVGLTRTKKMPSSLRNTASLVVTCGRAVEDTVPTTMMSFDSLRQSLSSSSSNSIVLGKKTRRGNGDKPSDMAAAMTTMSTQSSFSQCTEDRNALSLQIGRAHV